MISRRWFLALSAIFIAPLYVLAEETAKTPQVGQPAPDFTLPMLDGEQLKLSSVLKEGPVVLVVLRGYPGYQCPACRQQVSGLVAQAKAFSAKDAHVVLVYPGEAKGLAGHAQEFFGKAKLPANFHVVIDGDYGFTNQYGLRWNAPSETAYPSTFVIGGDGKVRFAMVSKSHGGRADVKKVLAAIESR